MSQSWLVFDKGWPKNNELNVGVSTVWDAGLNTRVSERGPAPVLGGLLHTRWPLVCSCEVKWEYVANLIGKARYIPATQQILAEKNTKLGTSKQNIKCTQKSSTQFWWTLPWCLHTHRGPENVGQPTPRCLSEKGRQLGLAGWLCWGLPKHVKFSFLCHFTVLLTDPYVRAGVWCSFGYTHGQGVWEATPMHCRLGVGWIGAVLQERLGLGTLDLRTLREGVYTES